MELRDLIVTPIIIFLVYAGAYWIRPRVTDSVNRRYFIPALTVRIIGALAVGFLYQFYYDGGDTFNFHTHGSRVVWEAMFDSPVDGFKLLFAGENYSEDTYRYASKILFYGDASSYFMVKTSAILDLITASTYSATAVLFAVIGFVGMWLLFITFYGKFPQLHFRLAVACFFIPSVFFWGSGLLKDTITLACLGMIVYGVKVNFIERRFSFWPLVLLVISIWVVFVVKKYILLCLLPALLIWIYSNHLFRLKSIVVRIILVPIVLLVAIGTGYWAIFKIGEGDSRYAIDKIASTSKITAYDIGFYTGRDAGSGYTLGELDGTFLSMISLAPAAINVALFRPYVWEISNPLMLLSSLESSVVIFLVFYTIYMRKMSLFIDIANPSVLFCLVFSLTFAFAVGVSTFNFGTLARYKIPLLPFFIIAIVIMLDQSNKDKKFEELEATE